MTDPTNKPCPSEAASHEEAGPAHRPLFSDRWIRISRALGGLAVLVFVGDYALDGRISWNMLFQAVFLGLIVPRMGGRPEKADERPKRIRRRAPLLALIIAGSFVLVGSWYGGGADAFLRYGQQRAVAAVQAERPADAERWFWLCTRFHPSLSDLAPFSAGGVLMIRYKLARQAGENAAADELADTLVARYREDLVSHRGEPRLQAATLLAEALLTRALFYPGKAPRPEDIRDVDEALTLTRDAPLPVVTQALLHARRASLLLEYGRAGWEPDVARGLALLEGIRSPDAEALRQQLEAASVR